MTSIVEIHQKALDIYLKHAEKTPGFTFATRVRNNADRLSKGYWFQGAGYVFTSPYGAGDEHTKTKTIGFVISGDKAYLVINFCSAFNQKYKEFYCDVLKLLSIEYIKGNCRFSKKIDAVDWGSGLRAFLEHDVPEINKLIIKHDLESMFFIDKQTFIKNMKKIKDIQDAGILLEDTNENKTKNDLQFPLNSILYGPPGTGKTYKTVNRALDILNSCTNDIDIDEIQSIEELKQAFPSQGECSKNCVINL